MGSSERAACDARVSRRTFLAGAAGALTIASTAAAGAKPARPRRVLWIMIDSLRADHLGYMGYGRDTSPWLDSLCARSANFVFTIAPADHTKRSVASAFTGKRYTELFTEPRRAAGMPRNRQTLADTFREAGYRTLAWSANTHVSGDRGFDRGFETFREVLPKGELRATTDQLTEDIAQSYNRGPEPEFIYVHTMDVHLPYHPPQPHGTMFSEGRASRRVQNGVILDDRGDYLASNLPYFSEDHDLSDDDIQVLIDHYDGAIRYTDERLPMLLDALRHDADDLLVITGDHGEQFYEHGFWNHGKSTHIEEIHVPLLMHGPGVVPGVPEAPVSLYDLYPTFCDVFGLAPPESMSGMSLAPALRGDSLPDRPWVLAEGDDNRGESACLIGKGYAYYVNANITRQQPWRICPYAQRLYDLQDDPKCMRDIAEELPEVASRMNAVLRLISPRMAPFTPELLRLTDEDIELQENLVSDAAWQNQASAEEGVAQLRDADQRVEVRVPVTRSRMHVVRVPYTLQSGTIRVSVLGADEQAVWSYECVKPRTEQRVLQGVFSSGNATKLTLRVESAGATDAAVGKPELRRAMVPYVPLGSSADADAEGPQPAGEEEAPSVEELERMKALGYLE